MRPEFYSQYTSLNGRSTFRTKKRLCLLNPNKFRVAEFLIRLHERRNDKIIVFCDDEFTLKHYALAMGKAFIRGATSQDETRHILLNFQNNPNFKTLFVSNVIDRIDLQNANVLIQIFIPSLFPS